MLHSHWHEPEHNDTEYDAASKHSCEVGNSSDRENRTWSSVDALGADRQGREGGQYADKRTDTAGTDDRLPELVPLRHSA